MKSSTFYYAFFCEPSKIICCNGLPGGTIGSTFNSCSMINSMIVGAFWFCFASVSASAISYSSVTRIPFAP